MKALLSLPIGSRRQRIGHRAQQHKEEIHQEAQPNHHARSTIAPHLDQAVVDNIRNRENDKASRQLQRPNGNLLHFQQIRRYQTNTKQYAQAQEGHTGRRMGELFHTFLFFTRLDKHSGNSAAKVRKFFGFIAKPTGFQRISNNFITPKEANKKSALRNITPARGSRVQNSSFNIS